MCQLYCIINICQLYWVIKAHLIKQILDNIRSYQKKKKTLDIKNKKTKDKNKRTHTKTVTKKGKIK